MPEEPPSILPRGTGTRLPLSPSPALPGSAVYIQSVAGFSCIAAGAIGSEDISGGRSPASISATLHWGSSDRREAITAPAEPPPTTIKSNASVISPSRRCLTPLDRDHRGEAEQRSEDQVIARRKRITGLGGDKPGILRQMQLFDPKGRNVEQEVKRAVRDDRYAERQQHRKRVPAQQVVDRNGGRLLGFDEFRRIDEFRADVKTGRPDQHAEEIGDPPSPVDQLLVGQ